MNLPIQISRLCAAVRQFSGSFQAVVRQMSGNCQTFQAISFIVILFIFYEDLVISEIQQPLIKAHLVSKGKIKIYIGCILCFSFVWNFPKWFVLGWVEGQNLPEQTDLAKSYSYDTIYLVWLEKVVLEFFIPLATLTVLNILLLKMVSIIFTEFQNFKGFFYLVHTPTGPS